jgi:hypothetical protein
LIKVIEMISRKQKSSLISVVSGLSAALFLSMAASAATPSNEAALIHNERAAQLAIVSAPEYRGAASTVRSIQQDFPGETTLARNEQAARCTIASIACPPSASARTNQSAAAGETTLARNERAAQRVIVDQSVYAHSRQAESVGRASAVGE